MGQKVLVLVLSAFALACKHSGSGVGDLQSAVTSSGAEQAVGQATFAWKSGGDYTAGDITAQLPDGRAFAGRYLQVTTSTTETAFAPYLDAWANPAWGPSGTWYIGPPTTSAIITEFSGKVLAHLRAPSGEKMRCQFVLKQPEAGLDGGGTGDCQLSTGESIFGIALK